MLYKNNCIFSSIHLSLINVSLSTGESSDWLFRKQCFHSPPDANFVRICLTSCEWNHIIFWLRHVLVINIHSAIRFLFTSTLCFLLSLCAVLAEHNNAHRLHGLLDHTSLCAESSNYPCRGALVVFSTRPTNPLFTRVCKGDVFIFVCLKMLFL